MMEMQMKTTMISHFGGEIVMKRKPLHSVGGSVSCTATMENIMGGPQKIKNRTLYDPAVPFDSLFEGKEKKNTNSKRHVNSHVMVCYLHSQT